MATTPILTLIDALVTQVSTQWSPSSPDSVERLYQVPVNAESLTGRKVWFFPSEYDDEPATRTEDRRSYRVGVVVAERYSAASAGQPSVSWVDTRVDFVNGLLDWLEFGSSSSNGLFSIGSREIWTESREPVQVYDVGMLVHKKFFWSELEFVFGEIA